MLWHIVRFDCHELGEDDRVDLERRLDALRDLEVVRGLRVARDVDEAGVTGLLVALDDEAALATYREHPDHQPVLARVRELAVPATRLDVVTPDDPTVLA